MTRLLDWCSFVSRGALVAAAMVALACGMRGPPMPPLVILPNAVSLTVTRIDGDAYIGFDVPTRNSDGSELDDLDRITASLQARVTE